MTENNSSAAFDNRLGEAKAGIKIAGRNINLRYADDTTYGRKGRTKEPLDESKRGE